MKEEKKKIGKRVRLLRTALGWSQTELSELLNCCPKHISNIECGKSWISTQEVLFLIKKIDVDPNFIFLGKDMEETITKAFEKRSNIFIEEHEE